MPANDIDRASEIHVEQIAALGDNELESIYRTELRRYRWLIAQATQHQWPVSPYFSTFRRFLLAIGPRVEPDRILSFNWWRRHGGEVGPNLIRWTVPYERWSPAGPVVVGSVERRPWREGEWPVGFDRVAWNWSYKRTRFPLGVVKTKAVFLAYMLPRRIATVRQIAAARYPAFFLPANPGGASPERLEVAAAHLEAALLPRLEDALRLARNAVASCLIETARFLSLSRERRGRYE